MKFLPLCCLCLAMCISCLHAEEAKPTLLSLKGVLYEEVTVRKVEPDGLSIMHKNGATKVLFKDLPLDVRQKYDYDEKKAEEYAKSMAEQQQRVAAAENAKEQERLARAEHQRKAQSSETDNEEFMKKVMSQAKMVSVYATEQTGSGLIGTVTEGKMKEEAIKGTMVRKNKVWKYYSNYSYKAVISGCGNLSASINSTTGETYYSWKGVAWRIGSHSDTTVSGASSTVRKYTASKEEAAAYYRKNGFK